MNAMAFMDTLLNARRNASGMGDLFRDVMPGSEQEENGD